MNYLLARLREPSTYAGLAALLAAFGVTIAPEKMTAIVSLATALAGAAAVFLPDRKA
jgi:hypothetical protein